MSITDHTAYADQPLPADEWELDARRIADLVANLNQRARIVVERRLDLRLAEEAFDDALKELAKAHADHDRLVDTVIHPPQDPVPPSRFNGTLS